GGDEHRDAERQSKPCHRASYVGFSSCEAASGDADLAPASMLALPACDGPPTSMPMAKTAPRLKM
ncbi:MAG: hypothetical protein ACXWJV_03090, partial [Hyphomicrobium sp.]